MDWYSVQKVNMYRQRLFETGFRIVGRRKNSDEFEELESDELNQVLVDEWVTRNKD